MQTRFTPEQLADPSLERANAIIRSCVHCGMCNATCPTYGLLGDELDGPRGRIYLIKEMLESGRPADSRTVRHIDRCLSCLSCTTTCPSGVDYMRLVDHAREHIERTYRRPAADRLLRWALLRVLPHPARFRVAMLLAKAGRPFRRLVPDARIRAMLEMAPRSIPPVSRNDDPQVFPAEGERRKRVAVMTGCAQRALNTDINDSTIRLLRRFGCEVVVARGSGCCGALAHHMGKADAAREAARRNIGAWERELEGRGLDAVVVNASGCGTTVKNYGHLFPDSAERERAERIAGLAVDVSELLESLDLPKMPSRGLKVAYHAACSLQHGQKITAAPKNLLRNAGFDVAEPSGAHLCCGSAGTYNILQPAIAAELKANKAKALEALRPDVVAAGNIGCMVQIASAVSVPVVHTVELLDWSSGGPAPPALASRMR